MSTNSSFSPADIPECAYAPRMTRAQALALRTAGTLKENCVVVITDGPTIGTAGNTSVTEIELNPVSPTELGLTARVHTTFDDSAWAGLYDIDLGVAGSITELTDSSGNKAKDIDADSPTVHTQMPWHLGTRLGGIWRDNYVEDSVLTAADIITAPRIFQNNKFINTTFDFTNWVSGIFQNSEVIGTSLAPNIRSISGTFVNILESHIIDSTINAVGEITMSRSHIENSIIQNLAGTANSAFNFSNANLISATITNNGDGRVLVTDGEIRNGVILFDVGAVKSVNITQGSKVFGGATIRVTGTAVLGTSFSMSQGSTISGKPAATDSITLTGLGGLTIQASVVQFSTSNAFAWVLDGAANQAIVSNCTLNQCRVTRAAAASVTMTLDSVVGNVSIFEQLGAPSFVIRQTTANNSTVRVSATATRSLSVQSGNTLNSALIDQQGGRDSFVDSVIMQGVQATQAQIIFSQLAQGTIPTGDQVQGCEILGGGRIQLADTTPAPVLPHAIQRCKVLGSVTGDATLGRLRIEGTSERVFIDECQVLGGELRVNNVPNGALSAGTSFTDNVVRASSRLIYDGGDNVAKQIRNNTISGQSSLTLTGLTGSAGGGLGDVFDGEISNQATVTVTGARVVGQPVRNFRVVNNSVLHVDPSGTVLQWEQTNGATVNTGAFRHSEVDISGPFTKTLTAPNVNKLANAAFDNTI